MDNGGRYYTMPYSWYEESEYQIVIKYVLHNCTHKQALASPSFAEPRVGGGGGGGGYSHTCVYVPVRHLSIGHPV